MGDVLALSSVRFYEEAEKYLKEQDLLGFIAKINVAIEFAMSQNDQEMLAKATYLQADGLYGFRQHKKALESLNLALIYNTGEELLTLKNIQGKVLGYLGDVEKAIAIFQELIEETANPTDLAKLYNNLAWVHMSLTRECTEDKLKEAKAYLDLANQLFDSLPDGLKWKIYNNYSVYYYYVGDYGQAIDILNSAMPFCQEQDLPYIYENLAEIYLKLEDEDVYETINHYMQKAEMIATKYHDHLHIARAFYIQAMSEIKSEQFFAALDTLYLAFEYFKKAEAYPYAFECLVKINELMNDYKVDRLKSLKDKVHSDFNGTYYLGKI